MRNRFVSTLAALLICVGLALGGYWLWRNLSAAPPVEPPPASSMAEPLPPPSSQPPASSEPPPEPEPQLIYFPVGRMFVSNERLAYHDGEMVLHSPKLLEGAAIPIIGGFDETTRQKLTDGAMTTEERGNFFGNSEGDALLDKGVVLLNQASPPGLSIVNSNVTLSAHRDIGGAEFYYIHTLGAGDRLTLDYDGKQFVYEYVKTQIHKANDWTITHCAEESLLTLVSCDPIGTSRNRIVVTARLVDITEDGRPLPLPLPLLEEAQSQPQSESAPAA